MKKYFGLNILLLSVLFSCHNLRKNETVLLENMTNAMPSSPTAESSKEAIAQGINFIHLDSIYINGINIDSTKVAFPGHTDEFVADYRQMVADIANYLHKNGYFTQKAIHFSDRIYFQPNGTVNYYFYNTDTTTINKQEEIIFKKALNEFVKNYKFPMTCKTPFAQCSPVWIYPK